MQFHTYYLAMPKSERQAFAKKVGTTAGHLNNACYCGKRLNPAVCAAIHVETRGAVTVRDLLPNEWQKIWRPEIYKEIRGLDRRSVKAVAHV